MGAAKRIILSFGVAVSMLAVNAVLLDRGAPIGTRFAAASSMGVAYAVALVAWQRRRARR